MTDFLKLYNHVLSTPVTPEFALVKKGKDLKGICPFCDKKSLSVLSETGHGKCFSCDYKFNLISFVTAYHQLWLEHTPDEYLKELVESRGIPLPYLKRAKLAWDGNNGKWLVPYYNPSTDNLWNLGNFRIEGDKPYAIYKMPNEGGIFKQHCFSLGKFSLKPAYKGQALFVVEGEWDALAMATMINRHFKDPAERPALIAAPGANTLPASIDLMVKEYEDIYIFFDNDAPGQNGLMKYAQHFQSQGKNVSRLNWDILNGVKPYPKGFDIRDFLVKEKKNLEYLLPAIELIETADDDDEDVDPEDEGQLSPGYIKTVEVIEPVESLEDYFRQYESHVYLTETNRNAILAGLALSVGTLLPGEPLWAFLIGPPSSGKTTFLESFGGKNEYSNYASKLTDKTLISGMNTSRGDASIIPKLNGKTFFIKDFTVVLGMPREQQRVLFDLLRDIYDGSVKITFGNGIARIYHNINFNILAGVTQAIYKLNESQLGERFLRIDYCGDDKAPNNVLTTALRQFGKSSQKKDALTQATVGYVKHVRNHFWEDTQNLPSLTDGGYQLLDTIARYISAVRTKPEYHRTDGLLYRPVPEEPFRLGFQFSKLTYGLYKIFNPTKPVGSTIKLHDQLEFILAKVAYDTCYGFNQDILRIIHANPKIDAEKIKRTLKLSISRVNRTLEDLRVVGLVVYSTRFGKRGRPTHLYRIAPTLEPIMNMMYSGKNQIEVNE